MIPATRVHLYVRIVRGGPGWPALQPPLVAPKSYLWIGDGEKTCHPTGHGHEIHDSAGRSAGGDRGLNVTPHRIMLSNIIRFKQKGRYTREMIL
jgi:hypothetical protein